MILQFEPYYKSVLWGGNRIARFKDIQLPSEDIGESWEISALSGFESVVSQGSNKGMALSQLCQQYGERLLGKTVVQRFGLSFPLLVKLIDAKADLSVQVHPNEELAQMRHNTNGKHEMWYVLDCEPDARIICGLDSPLDKKEYFLRVEQGSIMEVVATYPSQPDQAYYIPAGTIHAIGGGNFIAEIQQSSDLTYRIYDYDRVDTQGNKRQLHTKEAAQAIDYRYPNLVHPTAKKCVPSPTPIVDTPYFTTELVQVCPTEENIGLVDTKGESFTIILVCKGSIALKSTEEQSENLVINQGHTVLISADDRVCITSEGTSNFLKTYIH